MKFNFENLIVWQTAIGLSKRIYEVTNTFPRNELYGLTNQARRASTSIALNIAEGKGRRCIKEFSHFLYIARGSLLELVTCIELSKVLGYIDDDTNQELRQSTYVLLKKLSGLIKTINSRSSEAQPVTALL